MVEELGWFWTIVYRISEFGVLKHMGQYQFVDNNILFSMGGWKIELVKYQDNVFSLKW